MTSAFAGPCTLDVTVSAPAGVARSGIEVVLLRMEQFETLGVQTAATDAAGRARFTELSPAFSYRVSASLPDHVPGTHDVLTCRDEALNVELSLTPADAWFEGALVDERGTAVPGRFSIVEAGEGRVLARGGATVVTSNGRFRVGVRSGHTYNLYGEAEGHHFASEGSLRPVAGERRRVEIRLAKAAALSGRIVDADGSPVAGALVQRVPTSTERTESDPQGAFTLSAAPGAPHVVGAIAGNRVGFTQVGVVDAGATKEGVTVTLRPGRTVRGRVVDEAGRPIGPTTVVWGASALLVRVPVAADGSFVAEGVPYEWPGQRDGARAVTFFVHDNERGAEAVHVKLRPSETTVEVPLKLRER